MPDVKSTRFRMTDYALIAMMILPILACIVLKVLYTPASEGVHIAGAMVYAEFKAPLMNAYISEEHGEVPFPQKQKNGLHNQAQQHHPYGDVAGFLFECRIHARYRPPL